MMLREELADATRPRRGPMSDSEILDWLIENGAILTDMGGVAVGGCGCCADVVETPKDVSERLGMS